MNKISQAVLELCSGRPLIVVDDEKRENEGDLFFAAEHSTPELINFLMTHGKGLICAPVSEDVAKSLELRPMVPKNNSAHETAFTVSIDALEGITTGISASDRSLTLQKMASSLAKAEDFVRPGHIFPLLAKNGGVLERPGHTEAALDFLKLAGLQEVGVICEICAPDGSMLRGAELEAFAKEHELQIISIEELIQYRKKNEQTISLLEKTPLPTKFGEFYFWLFESSFPPYEQFHVLTMGDLSTGMPLARVHSECVTGDLFRSLRCDCGDQLQKSLELIGRSGQGLLIYLKQEGRNIGLRDKLKAYNLQIENGLDTVDANLAIGRGSDEREYDLAAQVLKFFDVKAIELITNNPHKETNLLDYYSELKIVPRRLEVSSQEHNMSYLETKKNRMGHIYEGRTL